MRIAMQQRKLQPDKTAGKDKLTTMAKANATCKATRKPGVNG
jgi:hypothetical protein